MNIERHVFWVFRLWLLGVLMVMGGGCSKEQQDAGPLRIGIHVWPGYEPIHLAKSLGHLDENVKLVEFASASNVIRAMKSGSIDGATLTLDEALVVKQDGIDIKIVLVNDFSAGGDAILLGAQHADKTSLKGLRIGVEGGAVGAYTLSRALELSGLSLADVTPVQLKPVEQLDPLAYGEVDGVVTFEPFRSLMIADGAVEVFSSHQIPGEIVDVTVIDASSIHNKTHLVENLVRGWYETLDFIRTQPERAYGKMGERLGATADETRQGFALIQQPGRESVQSMMQPGGKLRENTERLMRFMVSQQLLPHSLDSDALFP